MDYSPPDFFAYGISQARIMEWVAISYSNIYIHIYVNYIVYYVMICDILSMHSIITILVHFDIQKNWYRNLRNTTSSVQPYFSLKSKRECEEWNWIPAVPGLIYEECCLHPNCLTWLTDSTNRTSFQGTG